MRTNLWKISKSNALFLLQYMNMYAILARLNEQNKEKRKGKKRSTIGVRRIILFQKKELLTVRNAFI